MKKLLYLLIPAALWALVAVWVFSGNSVMFDQTVGSAVRSVRAPFLDTASLVLHHIFSVRGMVVVCLVLLCIPKTTVRVGLPLSGALLVSATFNTLLKNIFMRTRPEVGILITEQSFSFPSGHTSAAAAFSAAVLILVFTRTKSRRVRAAAIAACVLCVLCVGASRVYLGVHYPTDCIAGALSGFCVGFVVAYLIRKKTARRQDAN